MRKNGINRELRPIEGGICAPAGYKANAVSCGIRTDGGLDFAMILSDKRCSVGCVYASGEAVGGPVKISKRNMKMGYARAILVNSGIANCLGEESEELALAICDLFFSYGLERTEIVIASTGKIAYGLDISFFEDAVKPLWKGLNATHENSLKAAQAIMTEDLCEKQLSYSFDLGDYPCKIGVIFKGGPQISPNMATFLAFITTDVNISTPMLQKALEAEVRETLNMLNLDGVQSPNDTVCIFANGRAGNYKITETDSEYSKFRFALRSVLTEVCLITAREGAKKLIKCRVVGANSKQVARLLAKEIVGASITKEGISSGKINAESFVYFVWKYAGTLQADKIQVSILSKNGRFVLFDEENEIIPSNELMQNILSTDEVEIVVDLNDGNYSALAYGRI